MYEDFYGLKEKAFSLTPDPKFLFLSSRHREVMEHLNFGALRKEGFILITGDIGTGKTTICRVILDRLQEKLPVALMLNPFISEEELIKYILTDFGVTPTGKTPLELLEELNRFLFHQASKGRTAVLIVDEAQNLSFAALEQIRILSNLETEKEKLLQIVLVGQEELREKLKLRNLRQLDQRISVRYHLRALDKGETTKYIYHRLMVAGSHGRLSFSAGALSEIYNFSRGVPRLINMICDRALLNGYVKQAYQINAGMVRQAAKTLRDEGGSSLPRAKNKLAMALAGSLLVIGILLVLLFYQAFTGPEKSLFSGRSSPKPISSDQSPGRGGSKPPAQEHAYTFDKAFPYTVYVASYSTEEAALQAMQKLAPLPYPKFTSRTAQADGTTAYRVLLGKFKTRAEALEVQGELKNKMGEGAARVMEVVPGG